MLYTIFFFAFSISSLLIIGCQNQSSLISLTILLIRHCNTSRFMSRLQIIQGLYKWTVKQSDIYVLSAFLWKGEIFEHQTHQTIHRYFWLFQIQLNFIFIKSQILNAQTQLQRILSSNFENVLSEIQITNSMNHQM